MSKPEPKNAIFAILLILVALEPARAGDVEMLAVELDRTGDDLWSISATLQHDDTGWEHFADSWRVVDGENRVLGHRILYHPHVDEQPFTRSLANVKVPKGTQIIYIEAHDKVHGWTKNRLEVDLSKSNEGHLRVEAK